MSHTHFTSCLSRGIAFARTKRAFFEPISTCPFRCVRNIIGMEWNGVECQFASLGASCGPQEETTPNKKIKKPRRKLEPGCSSVNGCALYSPMTLTIPFYHLKGGGEQTIFLFLIIQACTGMGCFLSFFSRGTPWPSGWGTDSGTPPDAGLPHNGTSDDVTAPKLLVSSSLPWRLEIFPERNCA